MISGIVFLAEAEGHPGYLTKHDDQEVVRRVAAAMLDCAVDEITIRPATGDELAAWESWAARFSHTSEVAPAGVSITDARWALGSAK